MLSRDDPSNFELSPRFLSKLVEGGTGVGLLQRAQKDLTRRAFQLWLETGRSDERANWEDAERQLVHWRSLPNGLEDNTDYPKEEKLETVALENLQFDFAHLSRGDLISLCSAMQQNLRVAKSACSKEKCAARALRKELQQERARLQQFSSKLVATEKELDRRKADPQVPSVPQDTIKPSAEMEMEHFKTPRRSRLSHPRGNDCESTENHLVDQWFSDALSVDRNAVLNPEFHDFQVGKFDHSEWSMDETICPDGDSNMNLPKSFGPLYDSYDPDTQDQGDCSLEDTENTDECSSTEDEDFGFSIPNLAKMPKVWQ